MIYEYHSQINKSFPFIIHSDAISNGVCSYLHWHESLEILNCTEGSGMVIIDSHPFKMEKGATIVINSGYSHAIFSDETVSYNCFIIGDVFLKEVVGLSDNCTFAPLIYDDALSVHLNNCFREFKEKSNGYELAVKANILNALSVIYRLSDDSQPKTDDTYIKQAIKFIRKNFTEDISLDDIANAVGLSKSYFMHKFKTYTGCTANEFLRHTRCSHAKHLLTQSDASISEIATRCGFSDISYFTKVFKKEIGHLPSKYKSKNVAI